MRGVGQVVGFAARTVFPTPPPPAAHANRWADSPYNRKELKMSFEALTIMFLIAIGIVVVVGITRPEEDWIAKHEQWKLAQKKRRPTKRAPDARKRGAKR